MISQELDDFQTLRKANVHKITKIILKAEDTVDRQAVSIYLVLKNAYIEVVYIRLYDHLLANEAWMRDLHAAHLILLVINSQEPFFSTQFLDRLIKDEHIKAPHSVTSDSWEKIDLDAAHS